LESKAIGGPLSRTSKTLSRNVFSNFLACVFPSDTSADLPNHPLVVVGGWWLFADLLRTARGPPVINELPNPPNKKRPRLGASHDTQTEALISFEGSRPMSKLSQPVPAQGATHPPCPGWYEHHWDSDEDARQDVGASVYRHHSSERRMPYRCVDGRPGHRHEVVVSVRRHDGDYVVGETVIVVGGLCPGDALSVEDAGCLASILRHAELSASAERPEGNVGEDDRAVGVLTRGSVSVAGTGSTPRARPP
jgi:hypothetical protein